MQDCCILANEAEGEAVSDIDEGKDCHKSTAYGPSERIASPSLPISAATVQRWLSSKMRRRSLQHAILSASVDSGTRTTLSCFEELYVFCVSPDAPLSAENLSLNQNDNG